MSDKDKKVDDVTVETPNNDAPAEEVTPETETQKNKKPKPSAKPAKEECGFCVYLGPSIRAALQHGAVFNATRSEVLKANKEVLEKYPLVAVLIVPGNEVAIGRAKVETPGNLLYENYRQLAGKIN